MPSLEGSQDLHLNSVNSLVWADDIVLLSETDKGLTQLLKKFEEYCDENKLELTLTNA